MDKAGQCVCVVWLLTQLACVVDRLQLAPDTGQRETDVVVLVDKVGHLYLSHAVMLFQLRAQPFPDLGCGLGARRSRPTARALAEARLVPPHTAGRFGAQS